MDTERLFALLSAIHPLTNDFKTSIERELTHLSLPKNYMLVQPPNVAHHTYFLESGLAISYTFVKGEKQIERIWTPGQIIASPKSFLEQVGAKEFIKLMMQSEVLCISYAGVSKLLNIFPESHFIQAVLMNECLEHSRKRIHDLLHLNAMQRHEKLINSIPHIEQVLTQEHIASYLGIKPQSLSRLKKRKGRS